jgi:prepilin peptidase CpaA
LDIASLMAGTQAGVIKLALLFALVAAAAVSDARRYRIPNWLTGSGLLIGVALASIAADPLATTSMSQSLLGALVGFGGFFVLYALRLMGAGDVKLMAALGAFLGVTDVIAVALLSFAASGLIGLALLLRAGLVRTAFENVRHMLVGAFLAPVDRGKYFAASRESVVPIRMPFGVAIAAGTVAYLTLKAVALQ